LKLIRKTITFAHDKGGTGKTTTCINVAVELNNEFDVTVIDLDPKRQFTEFNSNRKESEKLKTFIVSDINSFNLFMESYNGLLLIDLGGFDSDLFRNALLLSDIIIAPLSDSDNDMHGLSNFIELLNEVTNTIKEHKIDVDCSILVNRVHHANKSAHVLLSEVADAHGFSIYNTIIRENVIYKNMLFRGQNACEKSHGTACVNIKKLVLEIKKKMGEK